MERFPRVYGEKIFCRLHVENLTDTVAGMKKTETIETLCRDDLSAIARTYAKASDLAVATVSRQFHGNQAFVEGFARGQVTVTLSKLRELVDKFAAAWPKGTKWPKVKVLKRPKPEKTIGERDPL